MNTTAKDIVARLINEGHINGEEAFILIESMKSKDVEYVPFPYTPPTPTTFPNVNDWRVTCSANMNKSTDKSETLICD